MLHYYVFMLQSSYSISLFVPLRNHLPPHQPDYHRSLVAPPFLNLVCFSPPPPAFLPSLFLFLSFLSVQHIKPQRMPRVLVTHPSCVPACVCLCVCVCMLIGLAWGNKLVCFHSSAPHPERSSRQLSGRACVTHARLSRISSFNVCVFRVLQACPECPCASVYCMHVVCVSVCEGGEEP